MAHPKTKIPKFSSESSRYLVAQNPFINDLENQFHLVLLQGKNLVDRSREASLFYEELRGTAFQLGWSEEATVQATLADIYLSAIESLGNGEIHYHNVSVRNAGNGGTTEIEPLLKVIRARREIQENVDIYARAATGESNQLKYETLIRLLGRAGHMLASGTSEKWDYGKVYRELYGLLAERLVLNGIKRAGWEARYSTDMEDAVERKDVVVPLDCARSSVAARSLGLQVKSRKKSQRLISFDPRISPAKVTLNVSAMPDKIKLSKSPHDDLKRFIEAEANRLVA